MDCFLYDNGLRHDRVKIVRKIKILLIILGGIEVNWFAYIRFILEVKIEDNP